MRTVRSSGRISGGGVPGPGGYLVPGGCTWSWEGGVPGPRRGVYLVLGGVPGPGGVYLVLGGVPSPGRGQGTWSRGAPGSGGVPGQALPSPRAPPACQKNTLPAVD